MVEYYYIKTDSEEGIYYLINHWNKYKTFFKRNIPCLRDQFFKTEADAKRSITKLLNGGMGDEYRNDKFTIIKADESITKYL